MRNALIAQVFVTVLVALVYASLVNVHSALAAAYGGGVASANGLLLYWRYIRGSKSHHTDPGRHLRSFVASSVERIVTVAVLFAAGIGLLKLVPLPLLLGFIAGQLALMISGIRK